MARPGKRSKNKTVKARKTPKKTGAVPQLPEGPFWPTHWLPVLVIAVLATLPYWQSLSYEYVLDDKIVFTENQFVQKGMAGMSEIFGKESFAGFFGGQQDLLIGARYRPLSLATFALEMALWGQKPALSHAINILLYALTGIVLYIVLVHLIPGPSKQGWFLTIPFVAALLFVLHPIHSEVVANVKGRDEILTLLASLGALYFSWRYVRSPRWIWLAAAGVVFFLGLLAKENALTFLAVIPLGLYFFTAASFRKLTAITVVLLSASILYLLIRYSVIGYMFSPDGQEVTNIMNNPFYGLSADERTATVFYTLGQYIKLLFFPHPLTHDYYPYQVPVMNWSNWQAILSLVLQLALAALAIWAWRRHKVLSFGILFYFITLSIVSNIPFSVGTFMNERFVFMPSIGFALVIAWLIADRLPALSISRGRSIAVALLAVTGLAGLAHTWVRVPDWENAYTLNLSGAKYSPNSARANLFLGTAIYNREFLNETDREKKLSVLNEVDYFVTRAVEILPTYGSAQNFRAGVAAEKYRITRQLGPLFSVFHEVATYFPNSENIQNYIKYFGGLSDPTGEFADFVHRTGYEMVGLQQRNYPSAIQFLQFGLQAAPNNPQLRQDLGMIYRTMGNEAKAREYLGE